MSDGDEERWAPSQAPYAIAVSQSWWALQAATLFAADAKRASGPEQQIYARQIVDSYARSVAAPRCKSRSSSV